MRVVRKQLDDAKALLQKKYEAKIHGLTSDSGNHVLQQASSIDVHASMERVLNDMEERSSAVGIIEHASSRGNTKLTALEEENQRLKENLFALASRIKASRKDFSERIILRESSIVKQLKEEAAMREADGEQDVESSEVEPRNDQMEELKRANLERAQAASRLEAAMSRLSSALEMAPSGRPRSLSPAEEDKVLQEEVERMVEQMEKEAAQEGAFNRNDVPVGGCSKLALVASAQKGGLALKPCSGQESSKKRRVSLGRIRLADISNDNLAC